MNWKEEPKATIEDDEYYPQAVDLVKGTKRASISFLQRQMQLGYNRAARIIEAMESEGIISKPNNIGIRKILDT